MSSWSLTAAMAGLLKNKVQKKYKKKKVLMVLPMAGLFLFRVPNVLCAYMRVYIHVYRSEGRAAERRIDVRNGCIGRIYAYRYIKRIYTCMKEGLLKEA